MPAPQAPLRERILGAAFCAFQENGYAGASMLEIATRAKVSKRELYAVCEDKAALLRDAIAESAIRPCGPCIGSPFRNPTTRPKWQDCSISSAAAPAERHWRKL